MHSYDKIIRLLAVFTVFTLSLGFYTYASGITPEAPLEAQWVPNAVKISFNSNGGGVAPRDQIYTYGIERSLPGVGNMIKSGYHVIGWAETAAATSPKWPLGAISDDAFGYADATKAIAKTLYAVWEADTPASTGITLGDWVTVNRTNGDDYVFYTADHNCAIEFKEMCIRGTCPSSGYLRGYINVKPSLYDNTDTTLYECMYSNHSSFYYIDGRTNITNYTEARDRFLNIQNYNTNTNYAGAYSMCIFYLHNGDSLSIFGNPDANCSITSLSVTYRIIDF